MSIVIWERDLLRGSFLKNNYQKQGFNTPAIGCWTELQLGELTFSAKLHSQRFKTMTRSDTLKRPAFVVVILIWGVLKRPCYKNPFTEMVGFWVVFVNVLTARCFCACVLQHAHTIKRAVEMRRRKRRKSCGPSSLCMRTRKVVIPSFWILI
jgi:hypothetical protein